MEMGGTQQTVLSLGQKLKVELGKAARIKGSLAYG
jgi:hypothetical protein